jgi:hypothetical protein
MSNAPKAVISNIYCRNASGAKPVKRQTFRILTREGWADATGYVLGGWAMRKGQYFWEFTELASGMLVNSWPCVETKAEATAVLQGLAAEGKVFLERRSKLAREARSVQGYLCPAT